MQSEPPSVQIDLTPQCKQNLSNLAEKYRSIRSDMQSVLEQIQAGNFPGDRITGIGEDWAVFKVRIRNSNIQKGKSAGYRLLYLVESPTSVLLLSIYSKSDREDMSLAEIHSLLGEYYEINE